MSDAPSGWITRWAHLIAARGTVLDVAAGRGRNATWLAARGHRVTAVDRDGDTMAELAALGGDIETIVADIESGPWPLVGRAFDAVVVTNYLWRQLLPQLIAAIAPGGVLLYETFAHGNEAFGKPRRPEFLLAPGELLDVARGLRIVAYQHGMLTEPDRVVQRIAAVRIDGGALDERALPLAPPGNGPPLESRDSEPSA